MKLLTEQNDNLIVETLIDNSNKKNYYLKGIYLQANIVNRNGRLYPLNILEKEVSRYNQQYISQDRAVGQLQHPDTPQIELDRVSHKIIELFKDGTNFIGNSLVLDTPCGKIVQGLLEGGVKLGTSSRGMGSLKDNSHGFTEVQSDFTLVTVSDIVYEMSAPDAILSAILEQKEWIWANGILKENQIAQIKKTIDKTPKRQLESVVLEQWEKFINSI